MHKKNIHKSWICDAITVACTKALMPQNGLHYMRANEADPPVAHGGPVLRLNCGLQRYVAGLHHRYVAPITSVLRAASTT